MTEGIHIVDEREEQFETEHEAEFGREDEAGDLDVEDVDVRATRIYAEAEEPPWQELGRETATFIINVLQSDGVDKGEFIDDRRTVHHFDQVDELRLVDQLDESKTDDVDLAALFALPDESLLFVGEDPTAKDTQPLFGFLVEPFEPVPAPTSAQDALDLLRPGQVRDAFEQGDEPDRQGEWWLLPTRQVPVGETFEPGVNSRPFGASPLANHVPREWGMTTKPDEFMTRVREEFELPESITTPPEVVDWVHRQHQRVPTPEGVPEWAELQTIAGDILVRGTLRHREDEHFVEELDSWHLAETHDMEVWTADEFDRVRLD